MKEWHKVWDNLDDKLSHLNHLYISDAEKDSDGRMVFTIDCYLGVKEEWFKQQVKWFNELLQNDKSLKSYKINFNNYNDKTIKLLIRR